MRDFVLVDVMADDLPQIGTILMEYKYNDTGLILGLPAANEKRRYFVTTSLIGWAQA